MHNFYVLILPIRRHLFKSAISELGQARAIQNLIYIYINI